MTTDDMELVRQYAAHQSESAFAALVSRHASLVYSAALRRVRDPQLAGEITQAVFIILARKAGSLGAKTILGGWLYRTACYASRSALKREQRRQHREHEAYMQSTFDQIGTDDAWKQMSPLLEEAMLRLGQTDRDALVLRYFEGCSLNEVGAALGASEDAAKKRVNRALEKLRKYFTKRGVVSTTAVIAGAISANSVQAAPVTLATSVTAVAIAKGAAASASTSTLIKGALKLMAWTKLKTSVVATAAILFATIGTVTLTSHWRPSHPPQNGRLKLPTGNVKPMIGYGYSRYGIILASDGSLWSWGEEALGWPVLGLGNTHIQNTASLRRIGNDTDWINVAVGDSHCLAIKSDGSLWAWGANIYHQLGDGTKTTRPTPVPSIPGTDWKQAAAGGVNSFALKNDGTLWAWGNNWAGQLGIGGTQASTNATQVGNSTNWTKIWAGGIQSVGLQSDGSLWFWGTLTGDSKDTNKFLVPTRISSDTNWADVCFGYFTVLAVKSDGTLWSWGRDASFYTGNDARLNAIPMQVGTENDWQACGSSAGGYFHLLMTKDGSLWELDASDHRQITPDGKYQTVKLRKIDFHMDTIAFAAGGDSLGVVLTRDGEVWTWGKVIGEHSQKDYWGPNHEQLFPESKIVNTPWQLSNIDPANN
jgi:RNA polymerase sigma factor (sigma-70 family)